MADKGGFRHFMLKEIFEQPRAVRDTFLPRIAPTTGKISLDTANISETEFRSLAKINIAASGSSRHAGLAGKHMIETLARVATENYPVGRNRRHTCRPTRSRRVRIQNSGYL